MQYYFIINQVISYWPSHMSDISCIYPTGGSCPSTCNWINMKSLENNIFINYLLSIYEPQHEISNNVVYETSKALDQPAHTPSLIRAFASHFNIL